jgi:hypothetical protein
MRRSAGQIPDSTGAAAAADLSGESLLTSVLLRIDDELERILILAHVGLDISLSALARDLNIERQELAKRVDFALAKLRGDAELAARLGEVRRAGQSEHYQALVVHLELQDWFCSHCGRFIVQRETGRPRKTCSDRCRRLLYEAGGTGWKEQHQHASSKNSPDTRNEIPAKQDETSRREKLLRLIKPIELAKGSVWWQPESWNRDRAMILVGFTCPVGLSSADLAMLDVDDVGQTRGGLELRLYRRDNRGTRYVTLPASDDPVLCPVRAMSGWRRNLIRNGHTTGPLFVRLDRNGQLPHHPVRLSGKALAAVVASLIDSVNLWGGRAQAPELKPSMLLPDFLNRVSLSQRKS